MIARLTGSGSDDQTVAIRSKSGSFSSNSGKPDGKTGFGDDVTSESEMVCRKCVSVFKTGATSPQQPEAPHVTTTDDPRLHQWLHQNSKSRPFDDPELRSTIESWSHLPNAVKSGIIAMVKSAEPPDMGT
jgi:hypothetical protein